MYRPAFIADASKNATYARLREIAEVILHAKFPLRVIDARSLQARTTRQCGKIAEATGTPFLILDRKRAVIRPAGDSSGRQTGSVRRHAVAVIGATVNREALTPEEIWQQRVQNQRIRHP